MTDTPRNNRPALEQLAELLDGRDLRVNPNYSKNGLAGLYPSGDGDWDPLTEDEARRVVDLFVLLALEMVEADEQAAHEHQWIRAQAAPGGPHERVVRSCRCRAREDVTPCPCGEDHGRAGDLFL